MSHHDVTISSVSDAVKAPMLASDRLTALPAIGSTTLNKQIDVTKHYRGLSFIRIQIAV